VCLVTTLSLVLGASPTVQSDGYPRQPGLDVLHYVFDLTLSDESPAIEGTASIRVRFFTDLAEMTLDLQAEAEGKGMRVASVEREGRPLRFRHAESRLVVTLEPPAAAGQETTLLVRYAGVPATGFHIGPNKFGERVFFSDSWPNKARQWIPTVDHPYDKATGEIVVTAPAVYQVVANGLLVDEEDLAGGRRRTRWKQSVPISTWLYALGAARFAVRHAGEAATVPLQSWVFPQDRAVVMPAFEAPAKAAAEFFAETIAPYPFEKLANVQAIGFKGGIEHASAIFYDEETVASRPIVGLVAHEVAHQWWGNSVTESDWNDVWLSEGFATYFALLFSEHAEGRDAFVAGLRNSREQVFELERKHPDTPVIHRDLQDMEKVLNGLVYQKGGWVLHMLRRQVGTEAFWAGIREHYRRHAGAHASTQQLRQTMESASGQDLGWFFDQWLRRGGVPRLEGSWRYAASRKELEVVLRQTQAGEVYRLSVELGLAHRGGGALEDGGEGLPPGAVRVELRGREETFRLAAERAPQDVVVDPGTWLLAEGMALRRR
jgi:aminopeptidase N